MDAVHYTADDGLKLLNYMGFRLEHKEERVFRERFGLLYRTSPQLDLVGVCWELYPILHFIAEDRTTADDDREDHLLYLERDTEFYKALQRTGVQKKLSQGILLDEVI